MEGKWKVRIVDEPHCNETKIYIYRDCGNRREFIVDLSKQVIKSYEMGTLIKTNDLTPTIVVGWMGGGELLQAIADGLCENGIKAKQAPVVQNELDATKYHLEDMREIVKVCMQKE